MRAIIVEDEPLAQQELMFLVEKYSQIDVIGCFDDGLNAFKFLQSHEVDIAFLDINVPSIDGMLLAKNIHQFARRPYIVFTTAYKEFAVDAFDLEAFDYLLKPLSESRVKNLLHKLEFAQIPYDTMDANDLPQTHPNHLSATLSVSANGRIAVIRVNDIAYLEAHEKITYVVTAQGQYCLNQLLSEVLTRLSESQFFRCHRSFGVNLEQIDEIIPGFNSTYELKLSGIEKRIPVSRSNLKPFRQLMKI